MSAPLRALARALLRVRPRRLLAHAREVWDESREVSLVPAPWRAGQGRAERLVRHAAKLVKARVGTPDVAIAPLPSRAPRERPLVVHLIHAVEVGGSQKLVFDIVRGLGDEYDMLIVTGLLKSGGAFGNFPIRVLRTEAELVALYAERKPALVHIHYWAGFSWFVMATEVTERECPGVPLLENVNNPVQAWLRPAVRHYAFVSEYARALQQAPAEPSSVVHPGVDLDEYQPPPELAGGETIGLVYRLENDKLARDTIELLIAIARLRPDARIVVVGGGTNFAHYVARTRAEGVRGSFVFTGVVSFHELPAIYDHFSLFCAPVHTESYGVVVPYAMAKNIPVCGYRVGALPELLGGDETLADGPEALARLAAELLADRARRVALGQGARARVVERFSLATMLDAYRALYRELRVAGAEPTAPTAPPSII